MTRLLPQVLALVLLQGIGIAAAAGPDDGPEADGGVLDLARPRWTWGPHAESWVYGVSYVAEDEPDGSRLRGASLLLSSWDETVDYSGGLGYWLSWRQGEGQRITGGGLEVTLYPWVPRPPFRFGPRFRLGAEHRRRDPDHGFGGVFSFGVEAALWIGRSVQVAVVADRELTYPAADRTQVGLALRFAGPRY